MAEFMLELQPLEKGETLTPLLEATMARMGDLMPAYLEIYSAFRKMEQRRFDQQGPGWAPLAESTVAQRESLGLGGDHPILNRTGVSDHGRQGGTLRRSLTTRGSRYAVFEVMPDGIFMGTSDPVAKFHQEGTENMPARPVVKIEEKDAKIFGAILSEWIWDPLPTRATSDEGAPFTVSTIGL
jgi:hypothetical protein